MSFNRPGKPALNAPQTSSTPPATQNHTQSSSCSRKRSRSWHYQDRSTSERMFLLKTYFVRPTESEDDLGNQTQQQTFHLNPRCQNATSPKRYVITPDLHRGGSFPYFHPSNSCPPMTQSPFAPMEQSPVAPYSQRTTDSKTSERLPTLPNNDMEEDSMEAAVMLLGIGRQLM